MVKAETAAVLSLRGVDSYSIVEAFELQLQNAPFAVEMQIGLSVRFQIFAVFVCSNCGWC